MAAPSPPSGQSCGNCGAALSLDDMTRPNCPYCQQVLTHHAQAAQHAALVNQVLKQNIQGQYPGMPADQVPQIGYQYGAKPPPPMGMPAPVQQQVNRAMSRALWIGLIATVVPLVIGGMVVAVAVAIAVMSR